MNTKDALELIESERQRQNDKWGIQHHDPGFWMLILQEEIGEVAQAHLEGNRSRVQDAHILNELVQAAAVIVAWIEDHTREVRHVTVSPETKQRLIDEGGLTEADSIQPTE